jgi:4-diphosphocytidyl-2-C-methyl-D-erythritol kinase
MTLVLPAYAKLNLTLNVIGRRSDGYHEIASVMQSVSLHDLITVERCDCKIFNSGGLPIEGENLVLKAARELEAHLGQALPFKTHLHKRIPVAAGLGGGSADAATFLRAAVALYRLRVSFDDLVSIAAAVGQDVPFFLQGGTALASGLGSTLEPLPAMPPNWAFVVVAPPIQVSTQRVYEAQGGGDAGEREGKRTNRLALALKSGSPISPDDFGNDLQPAAERIYPELKTFADKVRSILPGAQMTGSGGAFFAAFSDIRAARQALSDTRGQGMRAWLCRPVPAWA